MDISEYVESKKAVDVIIKKNDSSSQEATSDKVRKYPYDPIKTNIDIPLEQFSIYEYIRLYKRARLIIHPDYQRNLVWTNKQKSRFIESIILNFPLPAFFVNQQRDNSFVVIDGLQRTNTLIEFLDKDNGFALFGLTTLSNLNGHKFRDLPTAYQAKIEDKKLMVYVLKPSVPIEVVYELFDRINTGSTPLNRQEVRNNILTGKSTQLLKKLSEQDYFKQAIGNGVSPIRMKDREMILRYLSFKVFDYQKEYQGDMSEFIENAMREINLMTDAEIAIIENDFKRVMEITFDFFGVKNFRIPTFDPNKLDKDKLSYKINIAIFECVSYFFSLHSNQWLHTHKSKIIENYNQFIEKCTDTIKTANNFDDSLEIYIDENNELTDTKQQVIERFNQAQQILNRVEDTPF